MDDGRDPGGWLLPGAAVVAFLLNRISALTSSHEWGGRYDQPLVSAAAWVGSLVFAALAVVLAVVAVGRAGERILDRLKISRS